MKKANSLILAVTMMVLLLQGSAGRATEDQPTNGTFSIDFHCNLTKLEPSVSPAPTKSNCLGYANGQFTATAGDGGTCGPPLPQCVYDVSGTPNKPSYVNFRAYNIVWQDDCVTSGAPPVTGRAEGELTAQGSKLLGLPYYMHSHFVLTRVAFASWFMTLTNPHAHKGTAVKGHTGSKTTGGTGQGSGLLAVKNTPQGLCGFPYTPQEIELGGSISGTIN